MSLLLFRLLVIGIFFLFISFPVCAQIPLSVPVEIRGQVRYANGGGPAYNVIVRLERFHGGLIGEVFTDRSGKFRFSGLTKGQYAVIVRTSGFKEVQQQVDLETVSSEYVQLQLIPEKNTTNVLATNTMLIDVNVPAKAQEEFEKGRATVVDEKQVAKGISHLEKAISIHPKFYEALLLLGTAYMDLKQWDKAQSTLRQAIEVNDKAVQAYLALGEVYRQQKQYSEAEKVLQDGLKIDPRSWQARFELGRVYWDKGDIVKAGPEVGRALQLKPDFAEAHLLAGNILLRARQPENALVEFKEYLRLAPEGEFAKQAKEMVQKIERALAENKKSN
jgi:tetratricopeptide (TPR) repeat protein